MECLGHSSLTATERYVKLLPRPEERSRPTASTPTLRTPPTAPAGDPPEVLACRPSLTPLTTNVIPGAVRGGFVAVRASRRIRPGIPLCTVHSVL
jgi:hypothetical protein